MFAESGICAAGAVYGHWRQGVIGLCLLSSNYDPHTDRESGVRVGVGGVAGSGFSISVCRRISNNRRSLTQTDRAGPRPTRSSEPSVVGREANPPGEIPDQASCVRSVLVAQRPCIRPSRFEPRELTAVRCGGPPLRVMPGRASPGRRNRRPRARVVGGRDIPDGRWPVRSGRRPPVPAPVNGGRALGRTQGFRWRLHVHAPNRLLVVVYDHTG